MEQLCMGTLILPYNCPRVISNPMWKKIVAVGVAWSLIHALPQAQEEPKREDPIVGVFVNQLGYSSEYPKRFTVPEFRDRAVAFQIVDDSSQAVVFKGLTDRGIGDFSSFKPEPNQKLFRVRINDADRVLDSDLFRTSPGVIQDMTLQPMVDFMIDCRAVVGSHPSAFGGRAWRDGTYYSYELPSLVLLYSALKESLDSLPRQVNRARERAMLFADDFKLARSRQDRFVVRDVKRYFNEFKDPSPEAPDIVKLIHWGAGYILIRPESEDGSDDGQETQIHSQTVEQLAFFLAAWPLVKEWLDPEFYAACKDFVLENWEKRGCLDVSPWWEMKTYKDSTNERRMRAGGPYLHPYKGRHAPGHSILPNLLMYEVAKRDGDGDAARFLNAAVKQAKWIIDSLDWSDPRTTKGHRMSEHKTMTGLVWLLQNYPESAPDGLQAKIESWVDIAISRSENMWDFRRYDLETHWTIPHMNEPGNLGGFPACALSVSWVIDNPNKKQRLREISIAAIDALFGRNPKGCASPHHPELGWKGIERGWPIGYRPGVSARLETVRGALSSGAGTEMYPFNPGGEFRFPEGWSAFNAALNVGLAYMAWDKKSRASLPSP